jgi:hypothetical protein
MKDALDLAEGELREKLNYLQTTTDMVFRRDAKIKDVEDRLEIIAESREKLYEAMDKIEEGKRLGAARTLHSFCNESELLPPGTTQQQVMDNINAFLGQPAVGGGGIRAGFGQSEKLVNGAVRINYLTVSKIEPDPNHPNRKISVPAKVASVQKVTNGRPTLDLYYSHEDIDKMPPNELIKLAAAKVEQFRVDLKDKNKAMRLVGNMHPKLAEAMYTYCVIKDYKVSSSIGFPPRKPHQREAYVEEFKTRLKELGDHVFPGAKEMAMSKEEVRKLQQATQTTPEEVPLSPAPNRRH